MFQPFETSIKDAIETSKANLLEFDNKQERKLSALGNKVDEGKLTIDKYADKVHDSKLSGQLTKQEVNFLDESKIPRKYLVPDTKLILKDLQEGKKVAGCELVNTKVITLR